MLRSAIPLILVALLSVSHLQAADDILVVQVVAADRGFTDLNLKEKLSLYLSGIEGLKLIWADENLLSLPADRGTPQAQFSHEKSLRLASKCGARFLVWVKVLRAETYINSSTVVPLIFKSHKRKYTLETELRIVDSEQGRVLKSMKFSETCNSSRALAYLDLDESNEPALHAGYPQQMRIFGELEDRIAQRITQDVVASIRGQ